MLDERFDRRRLDAAVWVMRALGDRCESSPKRRVEGGATVM